VFLLDYVLCCHCQANKLIHDDDNSGGDSITQQIITKDDITSQQSDIFTVIYINNLHFYTGLCTGIAVLLLQPLPQSACGGGEGLRADTVDRQYDSSNDHLSGIR